MKLKRISWNLFFLSVIFTTIGCDQITKKMVRQSVAYQEVFPLIGEHLVLTHVENSGAFLSIGTHSPRFIKIIFLYLLPVLILLFGLYFLMTLKHMSFYLALGAAFVIGGGMGNVLDRLLYGTVTDFLHFNIIFFKTGVFNVADVAITTGILLIFLNIKRKKKNQMA